MNKPRLPRFDYYLIFIIVLTPSFFFFYTTFKSFCNSESDLLVNIRRGRGPVPPFPALLPVPRVCRGPPDGGGGGGAAGASHAWSWSQSGWACGASSHYRILIILTSAVLRIRGCLCRILNPGSQLFHPGSRIQGQKDPGSGSASKSRKTVSGSGKNDIRCSVIPDPRCRFFPIPNPDPGSRVKKIQNPHQRIYKIVFFTRKTLSSSGKNYYSSGSQKRIFFHPESWSRIQGSKRHRIPVPDPQHC